MTGHDPRLDAGRAALIAQLDEAPAKMSGITNREVEIRAYVEAYNDRVGDASLEYLRLALDLLDVARAESDQRAHAAHMAAYREGLARLAEERKRTREVRAAAIEEAAMFALEQRCERETPWDTACTSIARGIRALTDTPPQSEGG